MSTSFELPEDDSIARLPDEIRQAIAAHWLGRATSELRVALGFEALLPRLREVGAVAPVLELVVKAIDDERRHGGLCAQLASRYAGSPREAPAPGDSPLQCFGAADEALEVALLVIGMCCINESIASAWLRACQRVATSPTAAFANRVHLRDEIDHARVGWAHLASDAVTPAMRVALRSWTGRMIRVNVAQWKEPDRFLPREGVPEHGHLSQVENDRVVNEAVREVVLPGFAHVGIG